MGATLPLVIKASTFRTSPLAGQVGLLYGSNAAGAIVGTIAAGLYLIPRLGITRTFFVAAALNVIVGGCAVLLSALRAAEPSASTTPSTLSLSDRRNLRRGPASGRCSSC